MPRTVIRSAVKGTTRVTTQSGAVVHDGNRHGYPVCGLYVRGIWYTDEPANCPKCQLLKGDAA